MTLLFYLFHFSVHSGGGPVKWRFLCCSRTWIRSPLLISKLCPLATLCSGRIGYFFLQIRQAHVRWRGRNFCLFHFLGIRAFFRFFFFFWSYRREEKTRECCFHAPKAVIWCNWQVGSSMRRHSPPTLVGRESKERQIPPHLRIISTGCWPVQ